MSSSTGPTPDRDEQLRADLQQINRDATARLDAKLAARHPRRTICADCRWYQLGSSVFGLFEPHSCLHQNARDLVTGHPTPCRSRNTGSCPDFAQRDP